MFENTSFPVRVWNNKQKRQTTNAIR